MFMAKKPIKKATQSPIRKMAKPSGVARDHRAWGLFAGSGSKAPTVSSVKFRKD